MNNARKIALSSFGLMALSLALFFGWPLLAGEFKPDFLSLGVDPNEPQILVTAEYMTFEELLDPRTMDIAKRNNIMVAPNIRANYLGDELADVFKAYDKAGIKIVAWPLLPREHCLYLNDEYADEYLEHLDNMYAWADSHDVRIEALIVDIEPPNCQTGSDRAPDEKAGEESVGLGTILGMLDKKSFDASIPKFQAVLDKLHEHDTVAISTAMDYAAADIKIKRPVFQDISGGPSLMIDWDYVTFMHFGSQNTAFLQDLLKGIGMKWTIKDTRYLSYLICRVVANKYGNRAAMSLGQTIPGEGHGAVWTDPADLGKDAAVCKYAGVMHFGIYDFQGIVESDDPDAWIRAVREAEPMKPEYSAKAVFVWNTVQSLSWMGQAKRVTSR